MADKSFDPSAYPVPAGFAEILKDLNREILREQPADIYQFCANHFHRRLAEQRTALISNGNYIYIRGKDRGERFSGCLH